MHLYIYLSQGAPTISVSLLYAGCDAPVSEYRVFDFNFETETELEGATPSILF
jgi:hypothetical protein